MSKKGGRSSLIYHSGKLTGCGLRIRCRVDDNAWVVGLVARADVLLKKVDSAAGGREAPS